MDTEVGRIKNSETVTTASPLRLKADPSLVSDVLITTPDSRVSSEQKYHEDMVTWERVVADIPSDDEDGSVFDKNVASMLVGMNMVQYLALFKDADIGLNLFLTLTEEDLKAIGVENEDHRKLLAHGIANVRKIRGQSSLAGPRDDIADASLTVQEAIPVMCHTLKHINTLVILLRNYRSRLNNNTVRNQVMDTHHSAAMGAKILAKEALVQAELLKVQLQGMLLKLDPRAVCSTKRKTAPANKSSRDCKHLLGVILVSASISTFIAFILRRGRIL